MKRKRVHRWTAMAIALWMLMQAAGVLPGPGQREVARAQGESEFTYSVRDTDVTIIGYTGQARDVVVPQQLAGMTVKAIGGRAFYGKDIQSVTLPDTVESIGKRAFGGCASLTSVQLPTALRAIEDEAFSGCTQLRTLSLPLQLEKIGKGAFANCTQLQRLALPASLTTLGAGAFAYCDALCVTLDAANTTFIVEEGALYDAGRQTLYRYDALRDDETFTVPDGVQTIDLHAFTGCPALKSVFLPQSVRTMEDAFYRCEALEQVQVAAANTVFHSRQGVLYQSNPEVLWYYPCGKPDAQFALPEGCAFIQPALRSAKKLKVLQIPGTLTEEPQAIGQNWVSLSKLLKQSDLPVLEAFEVDAANARYHSAQSALYETPSQTLLHVPKQLRASTFYVAQGTQTVAAGAFDGCVGIGTVQLPEGMAAFAAQRLGRSGVTGLSLPSTMASFALEGNQPASLCSVTVAQDNPTYRAQEGLLYRHDTQGWTLCLIPAAWTGAKLAVPQDVCAIALAPEESFASLRQLEIPRTVQEISVVTADNILQSLVAQWTIYGWPDSAAQRFAVQKGITFVSVAPTPTPSVRPTPTVTPTPAVTATPGPVSDVPSLVHRLYNSFLKREADDEGFAFWTRALSQNGWTAAQVAGLFATSDEYRSLRTSDETYLHDVYRACLGREPDQEGLAFWLARLRMGYSRNLVLEQMLHCDEFVKICQTCDIVLGHIALTRPAERYSWLCPLVAQQCYAFFGELLDEETLDYLVQGLQAREISGAVLTLAMAELGEQLNGRVDDAQFVAQLYRACMGREGDAQGLAFWTQMLQRGQSRQTVMMHFFESQEFTKLCRSLDIDAL